MKTNLEFFLLAWFRNWEEFYVAILLSRNLDEQPMCFVQCTGCIIMIYLTNEWD